MRMTVLRGTQVKLKSPDQVCNEVLIEELMERWKEEEEARERAAQECKEFGFTGDEAATFLEIRGPQIYAELAEAGE
jgi:hypothetical protein